MYLRLTKQERLAPCNMSSLRATSWVDCSGGCRLDCFCKIGGLFGSIANSSKKSCASEILLEVSLLFVMYICLFVCWPLWLFIDLQNFICQIKNSF